MRIVNFSWIFFGEPLMLVGLFCGVPDWLGVAALLEPTSLPGQLRRKKQAKGDLCAFFLQTCDHSCVFGWSRNKDGVWSFCCLKTLGFWNLKVWFVARISENLRISPPIVFGQCFWYVFVESLIGLEMRSSQNSEMQILISSKWPIDDILLTSLDKSDFKMGGSKFWDLQAMIWQSL